MDDEFTPALRGRNEGSADVAVWGKLWRWWWLEWWILNVHGLLWAADPVAEDDPGQVTDPTLDVDMHELAWIGVTYPASAGLTENIDCCDDAEGGVNGEHPLRFVNPAYLENVGDPNTSSEGIDTTRFLNSKFWVLRRE